MAVRRLAGVLARRGVPRFSAQETQRTSSPAKRAELPPCLFPRYTQAMTDYIQVVTTTEHREDGERIARAIGLDAADLFPEGDQDEPGQETANP